MRTQMASLCAFVVVLTAGARADEVCDDFSELGDVWRFRLPKCGPSFSIEEREDFLRLQFPDGATAGVFDNWVTFDTAPTFERYDMGDGDWTITTRMEVIEPAFGGTSHLGLMFAFGRGDEANDVVFWGQYNGATTLALERTGEHFRPTHAYDGGPVSLQIEKVGNSYTFRHRADDADPWIDDRTEELTSALPVGRVGLVVKNWGGVNAPAVIADFELLCVEVPDAEPEIEAVDEIPVLTPIISLACQRDGDALVVRWEICEDATEDVVISVNGEERAVLPPTEREAVLDPPFPGGSILDVVADNRSGFPPVQCTVADALFESCDEFEEGELDGVWTLRVPVAGPALNFEDNPDFLRFTTPAGPFDNWTNADAAPTLERTDMGEGDWTISTRLSWDDVLGSPAGGHHVGLMLAFGSADEANDVVFWGQYAGSGSLRVERTGAAQSPVIPYDGAPVSLQIAKSGDSYTFSYRADDADDWTPAVTSTLTTNLPAPDLPVGRVGLIIKTWGGAAPAVTADFDYFCLTIPDGPPVAVIDASATAGQAPLAIDFSASNSTDPSGGAMTVHWDFGDGTESDAENVTHTFAEGGRHIVTLTVTDDDGNAGSATVEILVGDDVSPFSFTRIGASGEDGIAYLGDSPPDDPTYHIVAGGTQFSVSRDNGHFLHQRLSGDFRVTARIDEADFQSGSGAQVGLMARADTGERSPLVILAVDELDDGYSVRARTRVGGFAQPVAAEIDPPRDGLPVWLRLERQGPTFIGSVSTDGAAFTEYVRTDVPILDVEELDVGVAASAGRLGGNASYAVGELRGFAGGPTGVGPFLRGDCNGDGRVVGQVADAVFMLNFNFAGGSAPGCYAACDVNGDGRFQGAVTDAIALLNFNFLGGPPPAEPFPACTASDAETDSDLGCAAPTACP